MPEERKSGRLEGVPTPESRGEGGQRERSLSADPERAFSPMSRAPTGRSGGQGSGASRSLHVHRLYGGGVLDTDKGT